jgi:hypothetical protein
MTIIIKNKYKKIQQLHECSTTYFEVSQKHIL